MEFGNALLTLPGFATIALFLLLIITNRLSVNTTLVLLPLAMGILADI